MSALALSLSPYRLGVARPLRVAGTRVPLREGAVVRVEDADGHVGYGDLAPLPGLHAESLEEALAWMRAAPLPDDGKIGPLRNAIFAAGGDAPPSAWFALEAALVTLEAARQGVTPARTCSETPLSRVPVNALFDGDAEEARAALGEGRFEGHGAVKVKLARRDPVEEQEVLRVLHAGLPPETRLRLDANRGLTVEVFAAILDEVPRERIEYVEEPVRDTGRLESFHERTGLSVALDELLYADDAARFVALPFVTTLVLKPAKRGGVMETLVDAEKAGEKGKRVVISSCFESGLGLLFLAQLAAALMEEGVAAGLATDRWLTEDTIEPRFDTSMGWIDVTGWSPRVRLEQPA